MSIKKEPAMGSTKSRSRSSKKDQTPPAPAPILDGKAAPVAPAVETQAMTSEGVTELPPDRALAYSLHRAGLADRLTFLAAVDEEAVLVAVQALLVADGDPHLAAEVGDRLADLRRGRADAAGVTGTPRGLLWSGDRELLTPLSSFEHAEARQEAVAAAQRMLDAEAAEKARATTAKAAVEELRTLHKAAQRIAHTGEDYRTQPVEIVVEGARVVTRRLDTGAIIEEREATTSEIDRVSQVPLWGGR